MEPECTGSSSANARRLKALADPHRWSVVDLLMDNPRTVAELLEQLGLEQSLLSHHLRILRPKVSSNPGGKERRSDIDCLRRCHGQARDGDWIWVVAGSK